MLKNQNCYINKKTFLLKLFFSNKNRQRKNYSNKTFLKISTTAKLNAYNQIQDSFAKSIFLMHFDSTRTLYVNINAFKQRKFDAMIYHDKNDRDYFKFENFKTFDVQWIFFLNRLLSKAERKYWSTKLEMTDLI